MGFIKGPKHFIALAITNALDEYFVVDSNLIESKLLGDANIVLHNVALRPKTSTVLPKNATKTSSTTATVTGVVEEVKFSWVWGDRTELIKDAKLSIKGLKIKTKLNHGEVNQITEEETSNIIPQEPIDDPKMQQEVHKEGGLSGYIQKTIEMVIDALTLNLVDFELTIEAPDTDGGTTTVVIGGESASFISSGRRVYSENHTLDLKLIQTASIDGLCAMVLGKEHELSTPLLECFGYGAKVVRSGKRFGSFSKGLHVTGESDSNGLVLHMGHTQIHALGVLSSLLLSAPEDAEQGSVSSSSSESETLSQEDISMSSEQDPTKTPSIFNFKMSSMGLVTDNQTFELSSAVASYVADGSVLAMEADELQISETGQDNGEAECIGLIKGIRGSKSPDLVVQIDSVTKLHLPGVVKLLAPVQNTRLEFGSGTLKMKLDTIKCALLSSNKPSPTSSVLPENQLNVQAPFPMMVCIKHLGFQRDDEVESRSQIEDAEIYLNPTSDGTECAATLSEFENRLVSAKKLLVCGRRPLIGSNRIEMLKFASDVVNVHGGHSAKDWVDTLDLTQSPPNTSTEPSEQKKKDTLSDDSLWYIPGAHVEALKIRVTFDGSVAGVKNAAFTLHPFIGKKTTTNRDVVRHYVGACIKQAPGFITNAELFGTNILDHGTNLLAMVTPFGVVGSVAAMTAVDSVKGVVAAGKRGRSAEDTDNAVVGDFFLGLGYAAVEATRNGSLKRGKKEGESGNVIDWAIGTTDSTGKYLGENKARLGGAGGAGAGMMGGMLVGGPVGAVVGGILGGAFSKKTINALEKNDKQPKAIDS